MNTPTIEQVKAFARKFSSKAILANPDEKALHTYTDAAGNPLYWRIRLKNTGTGEKWIRPFCFDGEQFQPGEPPKPEAGKPLYGLHRLTIRPAALVWIVEGEKDVDALNKAFKKWAVDMLHVAMTSGGATSAPAADWQPLAGRRMVAWPDNDEPGTKYVAEVCECLLGIAASVMPLNISGLNLPEKGDAFDWLQRDGADYDALMVLLDYSTNRTHHEEPQGSEGDQVIGECQTVTDNAAAAIVEGQDENEEQIIARLATLSLLEYDRVRLANAELLDVRPAALDAQVRIARKDAGGEQSLVEQTEPHQHPVIVGELLDELRAAFKRHAILPPNADVAMSLWCAFTWFIDSVHFAPLLVIRAPESECGKTTVKDVVQQFVRRPLSNEGVSIAALFRVVEQEQPTLLLDDADSWLLRDPNDERHSLINSGHKRGGRVLRCVGDSHDLKAFSTFCAKVIVFIGKSKDTLHNRSIEIVLRRKMPNEKIIPLRNADRSAFDTLRAKLARMEADYLDTIAKARPDLTGLDNRAADNWEPLLAIADMAGGEWPRLARNAALGLLQSREPVVSTGVELLADIEHIFAAKNEVRIRSNDLQGALCADQEAGWKTYNRGREITPRQISRWLGEYGIQPKPLRFGYAGVQKGYALEQFQDAFARYLHPSSENAVTAVAELQPNNCAALDVTDNNDVTVTLLASVTPKPSTGTGCNRVTDKRGGFPGSDFIGESEEVTL